MKKWGNLLLCLLFSAGIWLIHNLSQSYSDIVNRLVVAESNIEGRSARSSGDVTVSARIRASGFRLLSLSANKNKPVKVTINPEDLHQDVSDSNFFSISRPALARYSEQIFGNGTELAAFMTEEVRFRFAPENHKKVPVKAMQAIDFRPQYMAGKEISVTPDSVVIYGEPSRIRNVESILTRQINLSDVSRSVHGTVRLEAPSGVRLSLKEVSYSLDVTRFVELESDVKISVRNVPAEVKFTVLPSSARVVFRCVFPLGVDPFACTEFYIDYRDFEKSLTGRCLILADNLPSGVIDCSIRPQLCECLIQSEE